MSSSVYVAPLRLDPLPSRWLRVGLIIVHGSALSVIAFLTVPWWTKLFLALGVIGQWWVSWRRHIALSSPTAVKGLLWKADDDWELSAVDGTMRKARLLPGAYVHPRLVVLAFVMEDKRKRAVVLPSDSLDPDCHRRLRVWLRLLQERSDARGRPQL